MCQFLIADDEILTRTETLKKIKKLGLPVQCAFKEANTINYILKPFSQGVIHNSLLDNKQSQKSNGNEVLISTIIGQPTKLGMKALHKFIPVPNQFYLVLSVCRDPEDSLALLDLLVNRQFTRSLSLNMRSPVFHSSKNQKLRISSTACLRACYWA